MAITTAVQALASTAVLALPAMAPAVAQALGISAAYAGVYIAIVYLGAMLASLAGGPIVSRFGAIRASQFSLGAAALGLALCAAGSLPGIALGAWLIGLGYGPITPASSHLLMRTTPPHRMSLVFSIKQTGVPLGGVLAGALVSGLLLWLGWQGALLAVAGGNLLGVALSQPLRRSLDADREPRHRLALGNLAGPVRLVLGHRSLRMLAGCSFAFSIVQMSLSTYLVTYLNAAMAWGLVAAGLALSMAQAGGVVGRVFWGWAADRWLGARRMLTVLAVLMGAATLAMALLAPGVPAVLVNALLLVLGASAIGWNGVYLAEVARQAPPGQAGLATGGTLAITYLGVVLGPMAFGALSSLLGTYRAGFAGLTVACVLCTWALLRSGAPADSKPAS
nr:MFS transporter [Ramlibacter aurantiacus]